MDIAPKYLDYQAPTLDEGLMYVHPLEDIKQSQMWAVQAEDTMNQLPSAIRDYLTFDTFDEDTERKNQIIDSYVGDIDLITSDIRTNGVTRQNQRAMYDLADRIKTDMATGDLSLQRDNYVAYNLWLNKWSDAGLQEPVMFENMKRVKRNELLNNKSRENIYPITAEGIISRPDLNSNAFIQSMIQEAFRRIDLSKDKTTTTFSWGNDEELANIINGAIRNADGGYLSQQYKYVYGRPGIDWIDPIEVVIDDKGNKIAKVREGHPYEKEAQKFLDELHARKAEYKAPKVSPVQGKKPGQESYWGGGTGIVSDQSDVTVFVGEKMSHLINPALNRNHKGAQKNMLKKEGFDNYARKNDCDVDYFNDVVDMIWSVRFAENIDDFMVNPDAKNKIIKNAWYDKTEDIANRIRLNWSNIKRDWKNKVMLGSDGSTKGLENGVIINKTSDYNYEVTDLESGITMYVEEAAAGGPGGEYGYGVNIDTGKVKYKNKELSLDGAIEQIKKYAKSYRDIIQAYSERNYITEDLSLTDQAAQNVATELSKYRNNLVLVRKREAEPPKEPKEPGENATKEEKKAYKREKEEYEKDKEKYNLYGRALVEQDQYGYFSEEGDGAGAKIISVNKYCGNIDGIPCVFECTIDRDGEQSTCLIGFKDDDTASWYAQSNIKNYLAKQYVKEPGGTIPDNVYRRLTDPYYDEFYDYITSSYVFNFSEEDNGYVDIVVNDKELERYTNIPFSNKIKGLTIRKYANGTYNLLMENENGNLVPAITDIPDGVLSPITMYEFLMTYSLENSLKDSKTFDTRQIGGNKSSMEAFIMTTLGVSNPKDINKKYSEYGRDMSASIFINATEYYKGKPNSNTSYAAAAFGLTDDYPNVCLGSLNNDRDISRYVTFTGNKNIDTYRKGGEAYDDLHEGHIIYLPNANVEGVVYIQNLGSAGLIKYVRYNDHGVQKFVPLEEFFKLEPKPSGNKRVRVCRIGALTESGYTKAFKKNEQQ